MTIEKRRIPHLRRVSTSIVYILSVAVFLLSSVQCRTTRPEQGVDLPQLLALYDLEESHGAVYAGIPAGSDDLELLRNEAFVVGYDEMRRNPAWVAYRVASTAKYAGLKRPGSFKKDGRTKAGVSHKDYTNTGFDRGHMAPNYAIYSRYGKAAQLETFLMSNVCPQYPKLNRVRWRELEALIAGQGTGDPSWAQEFGGIWIVTGPTFDDDRVFLPSNVEIPDAFYKIVVDIDEDKGTLRALAFIVPNLKEPGLPLVDYLVSVDEVESETGLDFFRKLDDKTEARIEGTRAVGLW
ncbi:DNA/RNA non-specific endonuclease [Candidatus Hydrogenedentota bacterium]